MKITIILCDSYFVYFCTDQDSLCSYSAAEQMNLSHELTGVCIVLPLHDPRF